MTRKDYELIAKVLRNAYYIDDNARLTVAKDFADELSMLSPRFDYKRFVSAATMTDDKKAEIVGKLGA